MEAVSLLLLHRSHTGPVALNRRKYSYPAWSCNVATHAHWHCPVSNCRRTYPLLIWKLHHSWELFRLMLSGAATFLYVYFPSLKTVISTALTHRCVSRSLVWPSHCTPTTSPCGQWHGYSAPQHGPPSPGIFSQPMGRPWLLRNSKGQESPCSAAFGGSIYLQFSGANEAFLRYV